MITALRNLLLVSALVAPAAALPALRSPWDLKPVTPQDGSYHCPTLAPLPKDIASYSFYSDDKKSVVDPKLQAAYNESQKPFRDTAQAAIDAAEKFRATGNREAAACVLKILDLEAANASLTGTMASNQSFYDQNWYLGSLAVTWLKVRTAQPGTAEQRAQATAWMTLVANSTRTYFTERHIKGTKDGTNNHYYWAGFAVMAAGIATDDRTLFNWGVATYNEAMSRIQPDGSLPLEMDRGQRALHYHVFALAPLTSMAAMGAANGLNLFSAKQGALTRLVNLTASGLIRNTYFSQKAGVTQDTPEKGGLHSEDVAWLVPYLAHFPDPNLSRLLHSVPLRPFGYLGGYPPE